MQEQGGVLLEVGGGQVVDVEQRYLVGHQGTRKYRLECCRQKSTGQHQ